MPVLARGPEPLRLRLAAPSLPAQLATVRGRMVAWAEAAGLGADTVDDVVLATHEALANVADHAYPEGGGDAFLDADCDDDSVVVVVRDRGRWRPPMSDPGWRGRGLTIIRGLAESVEVWHGDAGTTVVMQWALPEPERTGRRRRGGADAPATPDSTTDGSRVGSRPSLGH